MNYITITNNDDFNEIINTKLLITGDVKKQKQEIATNAWSIALTPSMLKTITTNTLSIFLKNLLISINKQAEAQPITFYMWIDSMPTQLCFNVLSGYDIPLPFGCKLKLVNQETLFNEFITSKYHNGVIPKEEITTIEKDDPDFYNDDDEFEKNFYLNVFILEIAPHYS